jgi:hypothetical protein
MLKENGAWPFSFFMYNYMNVEYLYSIIYSLRSRFTGLANAALSV